MDSHEARALLRARHETGLHSPAYLAQGVLIADIHETVAALRIEVAAMRTELTELRQHVGVKHAAYIDSRSDR
jgi:hypothetical protein